MKIAILITLFPPKWLAGAQIATLNIAKYLARKGHEVHILTSQDKGLPKKGIEKGFYVHRCKFPRIRIFGILLFYFETLITLRRIKPDLVHVQAITNGLCAFAFQKIFKKPYVVWCRGSDVYLPWSFKKVTSKLVLNDAATIIALTENMKQQIQRIVNKKVIVISNAIDLEKTKQIEKKELRKRLRMKDDEKIIIFVGRLHEVKGISYLIEAMNIVVKKNQKTRLLLIGTGKSRSYLQSLVEQLNLEEYISFIGTVPNDKVLEYMAASNVLVLPSLSEGFPVVLLEAMASGLPIVATRVGGLQEIIKDGTNGFLVEPKKPKELAEKISMILGDNELRERISRNNKEEVKKYSWKSIIDKLEKIYFEIFDN